ncbi:hypothetical protein F511_04442 [Dorcoceras hygrometricum]|uniref:Dystroglycan-like n=1 Tax=Dorcoceras hygrometricum TaxID=472368 RepID=A0A2Z7CQW5_9LAMI|nr:hypothetical protein F511_04442 [Dorcoceras hygrometricum]
MDSAFITNALQVNFDSVLCISDNDEMVNMFKALESTGLRGFLGCPSVLYEQELEQFFDTAIVQDGDITCVVSGKYVAIPEDRFAGVFNLPTEGLTDLSEVPNNLVLQARTLFSKSRVPAQFSCKMRLMKYEFRLLNDILAKSITVKAGSFDAVTHERFLMMKSIHFGIKVNWRKILFEVLKEMVDRTTKRAKGFAAQICVLLKGDPAVTLGEAKTFPPLKILFAKTVTTYVATNKTIDARGESDEAGMAKVAIVKKKSVSKKKSASIADKGADEVPVEVVAEKVVSKKRSAASFDSPVVKKTRKTTGKAASKKRDLGLVSVAPESVPIHMIEPISAVPAERPPVPKRKALKRKFRMPAGSMEEPILDQSAETEKMMELEPKNHLFYRSGKKAGLVFLDKILADTAHMERDVGESDFAEGLAMNHLLSRIDDLEKASANGRTQQDQDLRGIFKSVRQEVQIQKTSLYFEVHEFKKGVRAQSGIFTSDLADIRKEVRDLSKEFDDKLAVIHNDLLEFRVETQELYATLSANLDELMAFVTRGRDDKKGEVGTNHGRGQPPPEDRSKPGSGDGGSSGSRSEPSR